MSSSIKYSYTLWSPSDTVKDVAESLGIANLSEEVSKSLAMDVEYRINEVLEQATKFMKHSKRTVLTSQDINYAFRVLNVEVKMISTTGFGLQLYLTFLSSPCTDMSRIGLLSFAKQSWDQAKHFIILMTKKSTLKKL